MFRIRIIFILFLAGLINCSTLLTRKDYKASIKAHNEWDIQGALNNFPKGEKGSFITTMEKTYLNLLAGNPDIDPLIEYSHGIDNQIRFRASRELKSLFYQETPEGYYASEHEIIWMHLLLSWGYSMRGEYDKAYTEAKICSNLLSNNWSEEGRFDDPLIRVILGAMWAMCGEWEEAQVDLRAAYRLDPGLKWAKQLADRKSAPESLVIILGGTGPEPEWEPDLAKNLFRGFRGIKFIGQGVRSRLVLKDSKKFLSEMNITPDSSYWYRRHFIRDNEIQDIIQDSHYMEKATGSALKGTVTTLSGVALGIIVFSGGLAIGGGLLALAIYVQSAEIAELAVVPIVGGALWGYNIGKKSYDYSRRKFKEEMDPAETYRFVRFLPEYAWVGWSSKKLSEPVFIYKDKKPILSSKNTGIKSTVNIVSLGYYPDTRAVSEVKKPRDSLGRAGNPDFRDENGNFKLHIAVEDNNIKEVKDLIDRGADIEISDNGQSPFHKAVRNSRLEIAELLYKNGADINSKDNDWYTPLNTAVVFEKAGLVELLVKWGADVNIKTKSGWAPLHNAALYNNIEITKLLLKNGADVNAAVENQYKQYPAGSTPMKIAEINNNSKIMELLQKHGAIE